MRTKKRNLPKSQDAIRTFSAALAKTKSPTVHHISPPAKENISQEEYDTNQSREIATKKPQINKTASRRAFGTELKLNVLNTESRSKRKGILLLNYTKYFVEYSFFSR